MKLVFNDVILPVISVVLFLYAAATCHMVVCKQYGIKQEISKPIQVCKSSNLSQFYDSGRGKHEILFLFKLFQIFIFVLLSIHLTPLVELHCLSYLMHDHNKQPNIYKKL